MELKYFETQVKSASLADYPHGAIEGIASTDTLDRDGDIIDHEGWDFEEFKKNGMPLLWNHQKDKPIGKLFQLTNQGGKLFYKAGFSKIPLAQEVRTLVDEDIVKFASVGFMPTDGEGDIEWTSEDKRIFHKQKLVEVSLATIPSNLEAEILTVRSLDFPEMVKEMAEKGKDYGSAVLLTKPGWEETETSFRYRLKDPDRFQDDSFRTITLQKQKLIRGVVGRLKGETKTTLQSLVFPKSAGWELADAKKWLAAHPDVGKTLPDDVEIVGESEYRELVKQFAIAGAISKLKAMEINL